MAGTKVLKLTKNKNNDGKGKRPKPRPTPVDRRPALNSRIPFAPSSTLHPKFGTLLQLLVCAGLPFSVLAMIDRTMQHMGNPQMDLDCAELFAGVKTVAKGFQRLGMKAATYEIQDDAVFQDILDPLGCCFAISICIRLFRQVGLGWFAPVCSSWVWLNRSTSGRSRDKPLGSFSTNELVRQANYMVGRCMLIILMMASVGIPFCLEQPGSSVMEFHPCFQWIAGKFKLYKVHVWLGAYGGDSPKGTWIYSNCANLIKDLHLPLGNREFGANMVTRYVDGSGQARVAGACDLKRSQHYPVLFGRTIAENYLNLRSEIQADASKLRSNLLDHPRREMKDIGWAKHADLRPVIAALAR